MQLSPGIFVHSPCGEPGDNRGRPVDSQKFSPGCPQGHPGFAQLIPRFVTRAGDNSFTLTSDTARTCRVYAQKLSPGIHRLWETRCRRLGDVRSAVFLSYGRITASMRTLVDSVWPDIHDTPGSGRKDLVHTSGGWAVDIPVTAERVCDKARRAEERAFPQARVDNTPPFSTPCGRATLGYCVSSATHRLDAVCQLGDLVVDRTTLRHQ